MSIRRDAAVNAGANLALAFVGIGSGSFMSYRFGPEGRGVLGVGQVLVGLGAALGCLGIGEALVYARASGARFARPLIVRYAVLATLGGALLGLLVGRIVGGWLDSPVGEFTLFATVSSAATAFYLVPLGLLRGAGRYGMWNAARTFGALWWLVSLVVSGLQGSYDLVVLGCTYGLGLVALGGVLLVVAPEPVAGATAQRPGLRSLLAFGLPAALATAPLLLNARVDQLALAPAVSAADLGQYVAAVSYCWAVVPIGQAIANLATTRVAERPEPERGAALQRLVGVGVTLVLGCAVGAWVVAGWAIPLLNGDRFHPAVGVARVLLVGASLQAITFICEEGAKGLGRPGVAMRAEVAGVIVMGLALVLLVRHGLIPTALASTIGYVGSFSVAVWAVSRATGIPPAHLLRPSPIGVRGLLARLPYKTSDSSVSPSETNESEEVLDGSPDG